MEEGDVQALSAFARLFVDHTAAFFLHLGKCVGNAVFYCEGNVLNGDLVISLDTIRTNAELFHRPYDEELHRVIIHGILHLCGQNDKGPGEREQMEAAENRALALR